MRFIKIAFIVLLLVSFASCKDAQEPETLGYVVAIGIDEPQQGEEGYNITIQFANPDKISGGSSESGGKGGEEVSVVDEGTGTHTSGHDQDPALIRLRKG